jgi:hypothetical protein
MQVGVLPGNFTLIAARRLDVPALLDRAGNYALWTALFCATLNGGWLVRLPLSHNAPLHLYWFDLAVIATLALWAGSLALTPTASLTVGPRVPAVALGGLVGLAALGVPFAADPTVALGMTGRFWLLGLLYLYIVNRRPPVALAASALSCSLMVQAAAALAQSARQSSMGLGPLGEPQMNPLHRGVAVTVIHGVRWLRAYGLTDHPNVLGGIAVMGGLFLAATLPPSRRRVGLGVTAIILVCALSRGAWLAFGVGAGVLWMSGRRNGQSLVAGGYRILRGGGIRRVLLMGLGVVVFALIAGTRLNPRSPLEIQSLRAHLVEMGQAAALIERRPLLGVGANSYTIALAHVVSPATYAPYGVPVVHNIFLLSAAELGVIAPFLLGVLLLYPSLAGRRTSTKAMRGCAAALAACAVLGLTDFSEWASPGCRLLWVALAALWAAEAQPRTGVHRKHA